MALFEESGIVPVGPPPRAVVRRSVFLPAILIAMLTLTLGVSLWGRPLWECILPLTGSSALANFFSALAIFARASESPREARGWRLLGISLVVLTVANLLAGLSYLFPDLFHAKTSGPVVLGVISLGLATSALLVFPWKSSGMRLRARNIPGSFLFIGSILVILLPFTEWRGGFGSHNVINLALVATCTRLILLGGITLILLEQDPRRIRGVLGFVLVNVMLGAIFIALIQHLFVQDWAPALPMASIYSLSPLILGLAAWSRAPLEFPGFPRRTSRTLEIIPYITFALAATAILLRFLIERRLAGAILIGFISLTFMLLFRQFLLLRDLRKQNYSLERRVKDRTRDLEAMQAVILRTERLNTLSALGAGIAHDLNNFLSVIHTSVQLIEQQLEAVPAALTQHLSRIHATTGRAASLTKRLLGFARKDLEPPEVLDLAWELTQMEELLRILLPNNIKLHTELAPGVFPILSRKSHLEQILVNLVSNAKDAMPDGGEVTIRLIELGGQQVQIQVGDNGPGLPPEVREHLFEFFITTKGEGEGTGLGLPTVKLLVEGDGGTVRALSNPGKGCRFLITYPMASLKVI